MRWLGFLPAHCTSWRCGFWHTYEFAWLLAGALHVMTMWILALESSKPLQSNVVLWQLSKLCMLLMSPGCRYHKGVQCVNGTVEVVIVAWKCGLWSWASTVWSDSFVVFKTRRCHSIKSWSYAGADPSAPTVGSVSPCHFICHTESLQMETSDEAAP